MCSTCHRRSLIPEEMILHDLLLPGVAYIRLFRPLRRQISVYKHFFGAGKVCINTSPAPERCFKILLRLIQRRRSVFISTYLIGLPLIFLESCQSETSDLCSVDIVADCRRMSGMICERFSS